MAPTAALQNRVLPASTDVHIGRRYSTANSFVAPGVKGFGLMQRERAFDEYQDDGVFYEKRASAWVEPSYDWGDGAVTLIELRTDDEIHDNIVAMWTPSAGSAGGDEHHFGYRLTWFADAPVPPNAARFIATPSGRQAVTLGTRFSSDQARVTTGVPMAAPKPARKL